MIGSFINLLVLCFSYYDLLFNWFFLNWNLHLKVTRKTNIKNKHIKQPNQKVEKKTSTDISPKKKYRWLTNTWKDAQHRSLLEKCKSMRSHLTPVTTALVKKFTNNKSWRGCGEKGTFLHCWWECKLTQPLWKMVWRFLKKN